MLENKAETNKLHSFIVRVSKVAGVLSLPLADFLLVMQ